ncbi:MAG: hypothetical protein LUD15_01045 [Bacteroides sp.]|nr:hypothetical protein [Bacteroides sp.]
MRKTLLLLVSTFYISLHALTNPNLYSVNASNPQKPYLSENRIEEIAGMLPDTPQGIGVTYKDRKFWKQFRKNDQAILLIQEAEESLKEGMPPFVDSLYLDLLSSGVCLPGENMMNARYQYLWRLCLAECLENKKRFISAIETGIRELCDQKPWSIPAHDRNLNNYNGTNYYVDLVVTTAANSLAQCIYILDDKISADTRKLVLETMREKVFNPVKCCIEEQDLWYWFTVRNN